MSMPARNSGRLARPVANAAAHEPPARTFMDKLANYAREALYEQRFVNRVVNFVRKESPGAARTSPSSRLQVEHVP